MFVERLARVAARGVPLTERIRHVRLSRGPIGGEPRFARLGESLRHGGPLRMARLEIRARGEDQERGRQRIVEALVAGELCVEGGGLVPAAQRGQRVGGPDAPDRIGVVATGEEARRIVAEEGGDVLPWTRLGPGGRR